MHRFAFSGLKKTASGTCHITIMPPGDGDGKSEGMVKVMAIRVRESEDEGDKGEREKMVSMRDSSDEVTDGILKGMKVEGD